MIKVNNYLFTKGFWTCVNCFRNWTSKRLQNYLSHCSMDFCYVGYHYALVWHPWSMEMLDFCSFLRKFLNSVQRYQTNYSKTQQKFCVYCGAQFIWNVLYIIGLAVRAKYYKLIPEVIIAGIEIALAVRFFFSFWQGFISHLLKPPGYYVLEC